MTWNMFVMSALNGEDEGGAGRTPDGWRSSVAQAFSICEFMRALTVRDRIRGPAPGGGSVKRDLARVCRAHTLGDTPPVSSSVLM